MGEKSRCRICNKQFSARKLRERGGLCGACKALPPHERWSKAVRNPVLAERYRMGVEGMRGG